MATTPMILAELSYFGSVNGGQRLLYNETAARVVVELGRPAHRLAVAQGKWPAAGRAAMEMQLEMVKEVGILAEASGGGEDLRSAKIPALSQEEHQCARVLLSLFDYCTGRGIDLGKAMMLAHMHSAAQPRRATTEK